MNEEWDAARYEREKWAFIETRRRWRSLYLHTAVIFTATWLAGWLCSALLLRLGMAHLPLRYALSFAVAYAVFILCVRIWAGFMRRERGSDTSWDISGLDVSGADGEGCLLALGLFLVSLVLAGLFALAGGLPMLLEVAFELVFAGVVVRRFRRKQVVGDWAGRLVRNTWLAAALVLAGLTTVAASVQARAPGATTFAEALQVIMARR